MTVQQAFDLAIQHHQAGRLAQAEQLYRQMLAQQTNHAGALHMLGVIANQVGRNELAVELIGRAIAIQPNFPEAQSNLGKILTDTGHLDAAIAACRQAIALKPDSPAAHNNLGNALWASGQADQAIAAYRQAIALKPNYHEAHSNLGNVLRDKRQLDQAIAAYHQALALQPNFPAAHYNLGNALKEKGQSHAAIAAYRQAIALEPNLPEIHGNLGIVLTDAGQLDAAIAAFRQALALQPNYAEAHSNLGNALIAKGQLDDAVAAYRQAIVLNPNFPEAHCNLGSVLKDKGQLDDAIAAFTQVIAVKPDYSTAHSNLVYTLHFHPDYDAQSIYQQHLRWYQQQAQPLEHFIQPHANDPSPDRRLKIGYVSPDLWRHPVGRFLLPLFANHKHHDFEVVAYSSVRRDDDMTRRLRSHVDVWENIVGLDDAQAADKIRADGIDVLVDLSLHTAQNRMLMFARKPAPVQVTWLGYVGTTGLATMDYRLSDGYLDPPGQSEAFYTEKTLRLPHSYWCYQPPEFTSEVTTLPALSSGHVTFGCFNNFCKVTAPTLQLWAALLCDLPGSQLVIHAHAGSHQEQVRQRFSAAGVEPERICFVGMQPMKDYLAGYAQIDIALDPFPYGGGTTTCDALWMGVPVVTLTGRTAVGRAGVSLLSNVGLTPWIARTPDEYLAIARGWAADLPRLAQLRRQLRTMMRLSPLMDAPRFAAEMEAAYRQMWIAWCNGKP